MTRCARAGAGRVDATAATGRAATHRATSSSPCCPKTSMDERNAIVEIRAAPAATRPRSSPRDLFRMYTRYADGSAGRSRCSIANESGIGGFKEVVFEVRGKGAYSRLKFESGVHRVQRVPATEAQGRIHTSTATVVVLPEAEEVEVEINRERPADRCLSLDRARRPERQHDRLRRAHHAPADRAGRDLPGREVAAQEQARRRWPCCARASTTWSSRSAQAELRRDAALAGAAPATAARRSAPTTSRRTASPTTASI